MCKIGVRHLKIEVQGIHSMWSFYSQFKTSNSTNKQQNFCQTPQEDIENYLKEPLLQPSAGRMT